MALILPVSGFGASRYDLAAKSMPQSTVTLSPSAVEAIKEVRARFPGQSLVLAAAAATGSMAGTFDENYIVVLQDCPFSGICRGDVILFSSRHSNGIMHRVVETMVGLGGIRTQGDALRSPDPEITTAGNYLGKRLVAAIQIKTGRIVPLAPPPAH